MRNKVAIFRFYEELNDFLASDKSKVNFEYRFSGKPAIKDVIESLGVPHTEVDLIIINDKSVGFNYHLKAGDRVAVYPVFESLDLSEVTHLHAKPLRQTKFILDVHLGKLARYLRLLGFDVWYETDYKDDEIIALSCLEKRIILTRDVGILKHGSVTHGHWLRNTNPKQQVSEVLQRFDLHRQIKPFIRCLECNGLLHDVDKKAILHQLPEGTKKYYDHFQQCCDCDKIYWEGSHYRKMCDFIDDVCNVNKGS